MTVNAVAVTPGTFALPPIKASADLQPEVMGMTAAGSLVVCSGGKGCPPEAMASGPLLVPLPCPKNCNGGNGACRLDVGKCVCAASFSGEDCSVVAV